jgi:hypothetical protein
MQLRIEGFIDALAVFVRESRKQLNKVSIMNTSIVQRESDPSWVEGLPVILHPSIPCWHQKRDNSKDLELLTKEYVHYKQFWQSGKDWRWDYM